LPRELLVLIKFYFFLTTVFKNYIQPFMSVLEISGNPNF
jgi:hypothetical protein